MPLSSLTGFWSNYFLPFLNVGYCGALTTFGGFAQSTLSQMKKKSTSALGISALFAVNGICFIGVILGYLSSKYFLFPYLPTAHLSNPQQESSESNENNSQESNSNHQLSNSSSHNQNES